MGAHVFVGHNFWGAGNFGDDLSLAGFLGAVPPGIRITICTPHDRAGQAARFPQVAWLPDDPATRDRALRAADVWLGLGDTPFQTDSGPWSLDHLDRERERCAALGVPMYFLGVGCEHAEAAADPRARRVLAAAERVWTRDERSAAQLAPSIAAERLGAGADLAHLALSGRDAPPGGEERCGLLLAFEKREQFGLDAIAAFVAARPPRGVRWIVQEARPLPYVERWIAEHLGAAARERLDVMPLDYAHDAVDDYLRAFGAPACVVTSRYHGALVAAWHGSRVAVVARSTKLQGIAEELDLPQVASVTTSAALDAACDDARAVPAALLTARSASAKAMCDAFFAALAA